MTADPSTPPTADSLVGSVVDSRYLVLERIGQGGMGVVFKVKHTQIGKIAALKVLHTHLVSDSELLRRFQAEAEAISKLSHPNIVQVFDFGRVSETAYLVMEYLRGEDLGEILLRDGALALPRCVSILGQVCDALTEAHDMQIIHRDLKPENIRVSQTKDGRDFVKVLDFGLAKMMRTDEEGRITAQGNLVGTPYYMAPEQIRAARVDHRADIYALGALFYQLLTGKHAFSANTPMGVLTRHLTEELVLPSISAPALGISSSTDAVVAKAMAKSPDDRFASALELKQALLSLARPPSEWVAHGSGPESSYQGVSALAAEESGPWPAGPLRPDVVQPASPSGRWSARPSPETMPDAPGSARPEPAERPELRGEPAGAFTAATARQGPFGALSREDLAFEKRLRRARLLKLVLLIPVLAGGAFLTYWFAVRGRPLIAPVEEVEPNNEPQQATMLAAGQQVRGQIGGRVSATESDRDWYVLHVDGPGKRVLAATLSGIPNMDITVELYDALGGRLTAADSAGTGGPELLTNWPIGEGKYYLLVREMWRVGANPTENVTDWYRLIADWSPAKDGWEVEPNDTAKQATEASPGKTIQGYLGGIADVDVFAVRPPRAARVSGRISGIPGADLVLELRERSKVRTIDTGGLSGGESFKQVSATPEAPAILVLRRKDRQKPAPGEAPRGLDKPYVLETWLE